MALRWIQNVFSPADAAPLMSQEFAEMNPSSGFVTFMRSGANRPSFFLFRASVTWLTHPLPVPP